MRLLLDEMYPPAIAEQLRERGHDVEAVAERTELRALADDEIFAQALQERRAIVTENIPDFSVLADAHDRHGRAYHGLILVSPGNYPRGNPRTVGRMVSALDGLLNDRPSESLTSARHWL